MFELRIKFFVCVSKYYISGFLCVVVYVIVCVYICMNICVAMCSKGSGSHETVRNLAEYMYKHDLAAKKPRDWYTVKP